MTTKRRADSQQMMRLLLTTSAKWAAVYRERIKRFGDQPSAVIFPEQMLPSGALFRVAITQPNGEFTLAIGDLTGHPLRVVPTRPAVPFNITRAGQWFEAENQDHDLMIKSVTFDATLPLFLSRNAAKNWAIKQLQKM